MHKHYQHAALALITVTAVIAAGVFVTSNFSASAEPADLAQAANQKSIPVDANYSPRGPEATGQVAGAKTELLMPIAGGLSRVTKKPFGLKVSPDNSPVDNDIFNGYHTGIDFETTASEKNKDVTITASCDGPVKLKTWAKGYGGVLVQSCQLEGEDVTVIYGHMNLDSMPAKVGDTLLAGDKIGYLGQGETHETDGRRKHLHFDIHKGTDLNILGYVPKQEDLENWIDPTPYLQ
jgi:murein DD-endopeptidase MepM/ murein hydrolase activator NlpD